MRRAARRCAAYTMVLQTAPCVKRQKSRFSLRRPQCGFLAIGIKHALDVSV
jgi:hypothetical protein